MEAGEEGGEVVVVVVVGGEGVVTPWPLQTDSSITLCSITFLSFF